MVLTPNSPRSEQDDLKLVANSSPSSPLYSSPPPPNQLCNVTKKPTPPDQAQQLTHSLTHSMRHKPGTLGTSPTSSSTSTVQSVGDTINQPFAAFDHQNLIVRPFENEHARDVTFEQGIVRAFDPSKLSYGLYLFNHEASRLYRRVFIFLSVLFSANTSSITIVCGFYSLTTISLGQN
jgi:hypothetical protein